MKYRFVVPTDQIHVFSFILESYEDVGVITTESSSFPGRRGKGLVHDSVVVANIADDYCGLFQKIVDSLRAEGLTIISLQE